MADKLFTYRRLKRELLKELVPYAFIEGAGPVLLILWVLGAGLLVAFFNMPVLALLPTGLVLAVSGLVARDYLTTRKSRARLIRTVLGRCIEVGELSEGALKAAVAKGIDVLVEIVSTILDVTDAREPIDDLRQVFADAYGMLALQCESARRVEKYSRTLALIRSGVAPAGRKPWESPKEDSTTGLRQENIGTVERLIAEEQGLVEEIGEKLETIMLQVLQMERGAVDLVQTAQFAEEANGTLRNLQAVVTARRETAEMIRQMAPVRM